MHSGKDVENVCTSWSVLHSRRQDGQWRIVWEGNTFVVRVQGLFGEKETVRTSISSKLIKIHSGEPHLKNLSCLCDLGWLEIQPQVRRALMQTDFQAVWVLRWKAKENRKQMELNFAEKHIKSWWQIIYFVLNCQVNLWSHFVFSYHVSYFKIKLIPIFHYQCPTMQVCVKRASPNTEAFNWLDIG